MFKGIMNFRYFHFPNLHSDELDEALESSHWKWSAFAPIAVLCMSPPMLKKEPIPRFDAR